jgi:hypothetical protein
VVERNPVSTIGTDSNPSSKHTRLVIPAKTSCTEILLHKSRNQRKHSKRTWDIHSLYRRVDRALPLMLNTYCILVFQKFPFIQRYAGSIAELAVSRADKGFEWGYGIRRQIIALC